MAIRSLVFTRWLLVFFLVSIVYCLLSIKSYASDRNFDISVNSSYNVTDTGVTTISQSIRIKNKTEFYFTPTYSVNVGFKDIENVSAFNSDGVIPTTLDDKNPVNKQIKLLFPKRYAGLNETNAFTLKFDTKDIAKKEGNIWSVTIPGIATPDDFSSYNSIVSVPSDFGQASIVKPTTKTISGNLSFTKDETGKAGVYILFGEKQYYSFNLKYNISNPNLFPVKTEIALPPQTNYQNVIISSFSKSPTNVIRDFDGNWIGEYRLLPQQKETVDVEGVVEVLGSPQEEDITTVQRKKYQAEKKYWDTSDPVVIKATQNLMTPRDIYDFVVKTLSYNSNKVAVDSLRLGGKGSLLDPKNSVCLEFTDLFVTLARAKGIPARSVEGFAYTQNAKLRPLSLVNDILHAWPEYYDQGSKKWIMVDPTWGNTTHGTDYFNSLDFEHVAFVVKGDDSEYPIPAGGYKFDKETKDVVVKFAQASDFTPIQKISITDSFPNFSFPHMSIQGSFIVKNSGNVAISNVTANIKTSTGASKQFYIDYIPPSGYKTITTAFSDIPFLTNRAYVITIQLGNTSYKKEVRISFIPDLQLLLFIGGIIGGSTIITAITFHTGSLFIQRRKRQNSLRG